MQRKFGDKDLTKLRGIILAVILISGALTIAIPSTLPSAYAAAVPSKVLNLTATAISGTKIKLTWDPPASDGGSPIIGYEIDRKNPSGGYLFLVDTTPNTATLYIDTGLTPSSTYRYKVFAINAVGIGNAASNEGVATTNADGISPETTITSNPTNPTSNHDATFTFISN